MFVKLFKIIIQHAKTKFAKFYHPLKLKMLLRNWSVRKANEKQK